MTIMLEEILSQKKCLKDCYVANKKEVVQISKEIKKSKIKHIEILARGSSRNACEIFKYLLESSSEYRVSFSYPSTVTKYNGTLNKDTIYIAVSQGGRGEDLKILLNCANKIKALTIAITNEENTPLNKIANLNLFLKVGKENSMAATKTFSAEMLILCMLANAIIDKKIDKYKNINSLINKIQLNEINNLAKEMTNIKNLFVITRGKLLGVAQEACCKLQETCFINATAYASSDFMHGPLAMVDKDTNILFLVPIDETKEDVIALYKLTKNNKAKIYSICDIKTRLSNSIKLNCDDKSKYPFMVTFAIQLLSENIAQKLGRDPDESRNLNKYTKTI